jgi:hypothetical protein
VLIAATTLSGRSPRRTDEQPVEPGGEAAEGGVSTGSSPEPALA